MRQVLDGRGWSVGSVIVLVSNTTERRDGLNGTEGTEEQTRFPIQHRNHSSRTAEHPTFVPANLERNHQNHPTMRWYELTKYARYKTKQKPLLLKLGAGQIQQRGFSEHSWSQRLWVQSPILPVRIGGSQYHTTSKSISQAECFRLIRARFSGDNSMRIHEPQTHHDITTRKATYRKFSSKNDVPRSSAKPPRLAVSGPEQRASANQPSQPQDFSQNTEKYFYSAHLFYSKV